MRCLLLNLAAVVLALLFCPFRAEGAAAEAAAKACRLIPAGGQAESLDGWKSFHQDHAKTSDVWSLDAQGVLHCQGSPLGYLYTEKDYDNFVLELDWRWPAGKQPGKGGVLIRTTGPDKIWPKSLEAQINAGDAGDFWGLDGYVLDGPADRKKTLEHPQFGKLTNVQKSAAAEKPAGQWNRYKIVADGAVVTLEINGQTVNRATGCETAPGKILITCEGSPIEFRNVQLRPVVKPSTAPRD
ncbi:MAG: DUF1080 domain-containing protein [Candidatus Anammoximicrobium sp.]|nr:DUF1080 domain-containing protein [Candidatus Anammoximicrobium sp.]